MHPSNTSFSGFVVLMLVLYPFAWLTVALHELSHLLAGRLAGAAPFALVVGRGRLLYAARVGGVQVNLHAVPLSGFVAMPARYTGLATWRLLAFVGAGPACDLLIAAALGLAVLDSEAGGNAELILKLLFGAQLCMVGLNLVPMHLDNDGKTRPNDGRHIWNLLTRGAAGWRQYLLERHAENIRRYDPAFRVEDAWIPHGSEEQLALYHDACGHQEAGRHKDAAERFTRLLAAAPLHPGEQAAILDEMVTPALYFGDLAVLPQALQWSRRAHALLPASPTLQGSHGALLVLSGHAPVPGEDGAANTRAGLELLLPLTAESHTLLDRVTSQYYIALGRQLLGDDRQADAALAAARALAGDGPMLRRITAMVRERRELKGPGSNIF